MSFIRSNYGLGKKASNNPASSVSSSTFSYKDLEAELLRHVGGSFVYVKTDRFLVLESES
ncbi:hypothetical protein DRP04_03505 [Archaeoglobales archaeon]|nr:MAG: hypothetical protein DRP04_03505 [Archaeoglobales archaeon]